MLKISQHLFHEMVDPHYHLFVPQRVLSTMGITPTPTKKERNAPVRQFSPVKINKEVKR